VDTNVRLEVTPIRLDLAAEVEESVVRCTFSARGIPGWQIFVWLAPALEEQAEITPYGPLRLACKPRGRPRGQPEFPFQFENLSGQYRLMGVFDASGWWRYKETFPLPEGPMRIHAQGIVVSPCLGKGAVTDVVTFRWPR